MNSRTPLGFLLLLVLFAGLFCASAHARPLTVIAPANPTTDDPIQIQYTIRLAYSPGLLASTYSVNGNTIDVSVVFSEVGFSVGYVFIRQVTVPALPAGTYTVRLLTSYGESATVHGEPAVIDSTDLTVLPAGLPFSDLHIAPAPGKPSYDPIALVGKWNDCGARDEPKLLVDADARTVSIEQDYTPAPCAASQKPVALIVPFYAWKGGDYKLTFVAKPNNGSAHPAVQMKFSAASSEQSYTGTWYDPNQSGHGLTLEVLADGRLYANWFTYTPEGTQQAWLTGLGSFNANTVDMSPLLVTGGKFGPGFDPSKIQQQPWGTWHFQFLDCSHATLTYQTPVWGFGVTTMNLTRLTQPAGLSCPQ